MFFGDILSIENVCLDIRGNLLTLNSSVLFIDNSLFLTCFYTFFHRVPACCRGIKLLLIRRSRLALFARLRRFCAP